MFESMSPVLMWHGPLVGPLLAFVFGWVPLIVGGAVAAGAAAGAGVQLAKKIGQNQQGSTSFERTQGYAMLETPLAQALHARAQVGVGAEVAGNSGMIRDKATKQFRARVGVN